MRAFDHCGHNVALCKRIPLNFVVSRHMFGGPFVQAAGFGCHGNQTDKAVAAVDVQNFAHRNGAVRRIYIAVAVHIVVQTIMAVDMPHRNFVAQVMLVAAAAVDHFAEQPLLDHVQQCQFFAAVAAVFQQHARFAGAAAGADEFPAFVDRAGAADFAGHILSGVHRVNGDAEMHLPAGGNQNAVDVFTGQNIMVILRGKRRFAIDFFNGLCRTLHPVRIDVAKPDDTDVVHCE